MAGKVTKGLIQLVFFSSLVGACSRHPPSPVTLESMPVQEVAAPTPTAVLVQTPQVLAADTPIPTATVPRTPQSFTIDTPDPSTITPQTPQAQTTTTPEMGEPTRLLFRESIPREIIIDQIAWAPGLGGGGSCMLPPSESLGPFFVSPERAIVGTVVYFCYLESSPGESITTTVIDPGDVAYRFSHQVEGYPADIWSVWLDDPVGKYDVVVEVSSGVVSTTFEVALPVSPVVLIKHPNTKLVEQGEFYRWQPGDVMDVMYAGFEPEEIVEIVVFFSPCDCGGITETVERFATWQIRMDGMGQSFERLQLPIDWPGGRYAIIAFGKQQAQCGAWIEWTGSDYDTTRGYQCSAYDMLFLEDPYEIRSCFEIDISKYAALKASTILPRDQRHSYEPMKATDGMKSTAWVEGVPGPGIGEWIELAFPQETEIWEVGLDVGFDESESLFYANNRVRKARLHFSDDSPLEVTAQDIRGIQYFRIPFVRTTFARLEILDVYPGTRWDDTCLAEIVVRGRLGSQ
jgi:hypothetical protein